MFSDAYKRRLATALAGAALASALAVSSAPAHYGNEGDATNVAPSPSSIAASAAEEYQDLRSPDAVDAARAAGDEPESATTPRSGSYPAADEYQDMRSPDTRDAAEGYAPTLEPGPVADGSAGFDVVSAAIGGIAIAGLALVLMATAGTRPLRRRPAGA